ncbi:hypothetical protein RN001_015082 [Aquatica leii]|uniref:Uncharacterized protein n=1 Tax=Aquatica leii TaxID=1421715 RepID=A0AAN7P1C1_9COLE|nr:hypothetical protein RN001_015082 [Aquatica leii]
MALSQKHPGLMIVPWFNRQEWSNVYQLLRDNTNNSLKQAQEILELWKIRTPNLPSGVEGTLILLNKLLLDDIVMPKSAQQDTRGMGLMRFLNLCCASGEKQGTFSESAKSANIPEWIINARHDIAHKHTIPNILTLKRALNFCFDWILKDYWEKQDKTLRSHYSVSCTTNKNIRIAFDLYCQINSLKYQNPGSFTLRTLEATNLELKNKLDDFAQSTNLRLINIISGTLRQLLKYIKENKDMVEPDQFKEVFSEVLMKAGFFTMTNEDWCMLCEENELSQEYLEAWNVLIDFFFDIQLLLEFLKELLEINNNGFYNETQRSAASLWIFHIMQRLLLTQLQQNKHEAMRKNYFKRYPNLKNSFPFVRAKVNNSTFRRIRELCPTTINHPNKHTLTFLSCFLHVCKLPDTYIKDAVHAMDLYCSSERTKSGLSYLLKDLPKSEQWEVEEELEKEEEVAATENGEEMEAEESNYRFKRVQDPSIFKGCPLGALIFQGREGNPSAGAAVNHAGQQATDSGTKDKASATYKWEDVADPTVRRSLLRRSPTHSDSSTEWGRERSKSPLAAIIAEGRTEPQTGAEQQDIPQAQTPEWDPAYDRRATRAPWNSEPIVETASREDVPTDIGQPQSEEENQTDRKALVTMVSSDDEHKSTEEGSVHGDENKKRKAKRSPRYAARAGPVNISKWCKKQRGGNQSSPLSTSCKEEGDNSGPRERRIMNENKQSKEKEEKAYERPDSKDGKV